MKRSVDRFGKDRQGKLPVNGLVRIRLEAEQPGPTVCVVGGVHGDELIGTAAMHALDEFLQEHLMCGTVTMIPCANPDGAVRRVRYVPGDRLDLNRAFPGDKAGSDSAQLAQLIWSEIEEQSPDFLLDLHSDSGHAIPYGILDRPVSTSGRRRVELEDELRTLANGSGLCWFWEYPDDLYRKSGLERSLSGAVLNRLGIPTLTMEMGPKGRMDKSSVQQMVHAIRGIFVRMGLVEGELVSNEVSQHWKRTSAPRNSVGGVFEPSVAPGSMFSRGCVLGVIRAVSGAIREEIRAGEDGLILSWNDAAWLAPGSFVGTIAVAE